MAGLKRRRETDVGDPWKLHEYEIRNLYKSKTIDEVMGIMEARPGWPRKFTQVTPHL